MCMANESLPMHLYVSYATASPAPTSACASGHQRVTGPEPVGREHSEGAAMGGESGRGDEPLSATPGSSPLLVSLTASQPPHSFPLQGISLADGPGCFYVSRAPGRRQTARFCGQSAPCRSPAAPSGPAPSSPSPSSSSPSSPSTSGPRRLTGYRSSYAPLCPHRPAMAGTRQGPAPSTESQKFFLPLGPRTLV